MIALVAIEGTMFVLLWVSYFYLRGNEHTWPPTGLTWNQWIPATAGLGALLASAVPMVLAERAAKRGDWRRARVQLALAIAVASVFLALRGYELYSLPFRWDDHAYGSVFHLTLWLHTFHAATATGENLVVLAPYYLGPLEKKHLTDVHAGTVYWWFVLVSGAIVWAIQYLDPGVLAVLP